jgi:hypothetical protein
MNEQINNEEGALPYRCVFHSCMTYPCSLDTQKLENVFDGTHLIGTVIILLTIFQIRQVFQKHCVRYNSCSLWILVTYIHDILL